MKQHANVRGLEERKWLLTLSRRMWRPGVAMLNSPTSVTPCGGHYGPWDAAPCPLPTGRWELVIASRQRCPVERCGKRATPDLLSRSPLGIGFYSRKVARGGGRKNTPPLSRRVNRWECTIPDSISMPGHINLLQAGITGRVIPTLARRHADVGGSGRPMQPSHSAPACARRRTPMA